jgi:acyl-CoA synthetase (NDP forming)
MSLERLLNPASVAIVGASAEATKLSGMIVGFLRRSGFPGRVYPVNPRYPEVGGWRCYPSADDLPEAVDVMVVAVPVAVALPALAAAGRRGVKFAVLMTGGFGEGASGAAGEANRQQLETICRETGLRVIGPNIVGMVNFRARLPLTFADWYGRDTGQRGGVAILTHSGSMGGLIFSALQINRIGVDFWVGTGNEADLEIADFIDHFSADPDLHTIICYMEGVGDGRRFLRAAEKARVAGKSIVVLKAGDSPDARRSTRAHTCKQPTEPDIYRAAFRQLGVVQVASLAELTYAVKLLAAGARRTRGAVGIISSSGGSCSMIADHIASAGLSVPELPEDVQTALARWIPDYGSTLNPVDLSADVVARGEILTGTFAALRADRTVDTWLVFGRPIIDRYHAAIRAFARESGKLVLVSSVVPMTAEVEAALNEDDVPVLDDPQLCMRALGAILAAGPLDSPATDWDDVPTPRDTPAPIANEPAGLSLHVTIGEDADFGSVLTLQRGEAARAVCILPAGRAVLEEAARRAVPGASAGLVAALEAACAQYRRTGEAMDMRVPLSSDTGG